MENPDPTAGKTSPPEDAADLSRRLRRLRRRLESEGRSRSVKLIDRALDDLGESHGAGPDEKP